MCSSDLAGEGLGRLGRRAALRLQSPQPPLELRDRAQNPAAMPKQNAEILEVLLRQIADDREVNAVVGEPSGVIRAFDAVTGKFAEVVNFQVAAEPAARKP